MPVEQIAGQYQATPQTFTDGTIAVQVDEQGNLKVAGTGTGGAVEVISPAYDTNADADRSLAVNSDGVAYDDTAPVPVIAGIPAGRWSYAAGASGISNTTTAVTIKAAGTGSQVNNLTGLQIENSTLGAATEVAIRNGAGGAVLWRGFCGTVAGRSSMTFNPPLRSSAATLLEVVTLTATVTGGVYVNAQGYTE